MQQTTRYTPRVGTFGTALLAQAPAVAELVQRTADLEATRDAADYLFQTMDAPGFARASARLPGPEVELEFATRLEGARRRITGITRCNA